MEQLAEETQGAPALPSPWIHSFTFILTWQCNFRCRYCRQPHDGPTLTPEEVEWACRWLVPQLELGATVNFFGGEPLLAWDSLVRAVETLSSAGKLGITCSIVSNGWFLTPSRLDFLEQHRISLRLSFDGPFQGRSRRQGSRKRLERLIRELSRRLGIGVELQAVVEPQTVDSLADALTEMADLGPFRISLLPDSFADWNEFHLIELEEQLAVLAGRWGRSGMENPFSCFDPAPPISQRTFRCAAGLGRLALAPDGSLWGCHRFAVHASLHRTDPTLSSYCLGRIPVEGKLLPTAPHLPYEPFYQRRYRVGDSYCTLCDDVTSCRTCPIDNGESTGNLLDAPSWRCGWNRVMRRIRTSIS